MRVSDGHTQVLSGLGECELLTMNAVGSRYSIPLLGDTYDLALAGLSHPFLGMGPGPLELGKIALF